MAYLHQKRLNFIQKGQNEVHYLKQTWKRDICIRKYQKSEFILLILDGVWGLFLIQTFLKNLGFQNSQIEIEMFLFLFPPPQAPLGNISVIFLNNYPNLT